MEPEKDKTVCKNPWCKATFGYTESEMINIEGFENKFPPQQCPKCKSFNNELSGGIEWKDKEYEGSRFDGMAHQMRYKITNYK